MREISHLLEHLRKAVETGEPFFPQEHDIEVLEKYTNPSAEAVSMEEHVKELNDLAVAWKAKFDNAEKIVDQQIRDAFNSGYSCGMEQTKEALSAQADWIPCSERLPSEDGRYLVTYPLFVRKDKWVNVLWYGKPSMPNIKVKGKCWWRSDDEYGDVVYDDVLAWMPLPKPYREDGE